MTRRIRRFIRSILGKDKPEPALFFDPFYDPEQERFWGNYEHSYKMATDPKYAAGHQEKLQPSLAPWDPAYQLQSQALQQAQRNYNDLLGLMYNQAAHTIQRPLLMDTNEPDRFVELIQPKLWDTGFLSNPFRL